MTRNNGGLIARLLVVGLSAPLWAYLAVLLRRLQRTEVTSLGLDTVFLFYALAALATLTWCGSWWLLRSGQGKTGTYRWYVAASLVPTAVMLYFNATGLVWDIRKEGPPNLIEWFLDGLIR